MANADSTVWIVDDDVDVLQALHLQLSTAGFDAITCQSGAELLDVIDPAQPGCILLDLRMPGMSGLDVQKELGKRGDPHPVVFLSGHGDIPVAVKAVKSGAHEFLEKPVRSKKLLTVLERALDLDRADRRVQAEEQRLRTLKQSLTRRESDVANLLLDGLRSAEIAERLQLSSRTVEMHRARLFKRLGARTTADAARILQQLRDLNDPTSKIQ